MAEYLGMECITHGSGGQPLLVIVCGSAASGKTTLATAIAQEFGLPMLARDAFKEALMDALGAPDRERSRQIGGASYAVLYRALDQLLAANVGAVIESNFTHGLAERDLAGRVVSARAVQIHCHADPTVVRARYIARAAAGLRHPGHFDLHPETLAELDASLAGDRHRALDLHVPLMRIDATNGYAPGLAEVSTFIASHMIGRDDLDGRSPAF